MSRAVKGRYPWLVGATSYVMPADVVTNVKNLAGKVDAVQLLFFESAANAELAHPVDIPELNRIAGEHDLAYTVHLPADLNLGDQQPAVRTRAIDEIERLVNELAVLVPRSYDLHVQRQESLPEARWLENVETSLAQLADRLGTAKELVAIENIDYPFSLIQEIVEACGFSRCLDLGHVLRHGHNLQDAWRAVDEARHIHYHGVAGGRDHGAIAPSQAEITEALGEELKRAGYSGVVTLEVYSMDKLDASLQTLATAWKEYERSEHR